MTKTKFSAVPVIAFLNYVGEEEKLSFEPIPGAEKHFPLVRPDEKDLKKLRKESLQFAADIYRFISWMDEEMKKHSTEERGKRIASGLNGLEMCVDRFTHFELHQSFEKITKMKKEKP